MEKRKLTRKLQSRHRAYGRTYYVRVVRETHWHFGPGWVGIAQSRSGREIARSRHHPGGSSYAYLEACLFAQQRLRAEVV